MEKEVTSCPKCGSGKIKKAGPFSPRARDGEEFASKPHPAQYHCWNCNNDWADDEK